MNCANRVSSLDNPHLTGECFLHFQTLMNARALTIVMVTPSASTLLARTNVFVEQGTQGMAFIAMVRSYYNA